LHITQHGEALVPELFIDGAFVSPRDGGRRAITCPADGQTHRADRRVDPARRRGVTALKDDALPTMEVPTPSIRKTST
jgi:hypothetical protein